MKKITVLLIIAAILLAACQRTPEEEAVNRRSYEKLLAVNKDAGKVEFPDSFSDEFVSKDKKVNVIFDAKIIAPDVKKYPVIQIKPRPVTDELMQIMVDEFMGGETGYYPEGYMTKSEIEDRLLGYYAKLNNQTLIKEEYDKNMPGADIDYDAVTEAVKNRIAEYTAMLENAPEEKENVPSHYDLRPFEFYITDDHNFRETELAMTQEELDFRAGSPEENLYLVSDRQIGNDHMRFIVYQELPTLPGQPHNFGLHSAEYYGLHIIRARNDYLELIEKPLCSASPTNTSREGVENFDVPYPNLTISLEEAEQLAQKTLGDLGTDDFNLVYSRVEKANFSPEESAEYFGKAAEDDSFSMKELREKQPDKFYFLTFRPEYYGIPLIYANNRYSQEQITYLPYTFEEIKMRVSNDVIAEFKWSNPMDVSNVLNENAKLLPFDEIAKLAVNHMKLKYNMITVASLPEDFPSYEEELAKYLSAEIIISEIRLGLGGVPAYNSPGEYMLIPMWSFYGSVAIERQDRQGQQYEDLLMPLLSINAVDGSVIDQSVWADLN